MMRPHASLVVAAVSLLAAPAAAFADIPAPPPTPPSVAAVAARMAEVSPERVKASVEKLVSFGTRHTLSDTANPDKGIGAAQRWLAEQLVRNPAFEGSFEVFDAPKSVRLPNGAKMANIVARLMGSNDESKDRAYYVVGHYDSRNADAMDAAGDAPGANDDASGVAVVLECARVLSKYRCDSTIFFLCTDGEEQGLVGAQFHAKSLEASGKYRLVQVLNNDIVGDPSPAFVLNDNAPTPGGNADDGSAMSTVRLFSEGIPRNANAETLARIRSEGAESDSASRQLARFVSYVARRERTELQPMMVFRQDRFLRGGDHVAFNEAGFAAVRFSVPGEDYSRQHQNVTTKDGKPYGDLPGFVDADYLANVTRLNLAALMHLANAPTPPGDARIVTAELATDTLMRWSPSPELDTAGYEVVWRETTDADWTRSRDVGNVTEVRLPMSKDNFFFGVRAYDKDSYRSPVSFAWAAKK